MPNQSKTGGIIAEIAKRKLATLHKEHAADPNERLEDFIVRVSPKFQKPLHLGPILEELNDVFHRPLRFLFSVPPRHSKSESLCHLAAMILSKDPTKRIAYITYSEELSVLFSRKVQEYARNAGVQISKTVKSASHWETTAGGYFSAVGLGGTLTGKGFDLVICDDPHKSRTEANSIRTRDMAYEMFMTAGLTRLEPGGSAICCHTRWHSDDVIGRLSQKENWKYINIPAIIDDPDGTKRAIWPQRFTLDDFNAILADQGEYEFYSLYMGQPRKKGGSIYNDVHTYDQLPVDKKPDAVGIGIDLAYTEKSHADYSVAVAGVRYGNDIYLTDLRRKQVVPDKFADEIRELKSASPNATMFWFISGVEKGIVNLMKTMGLQIKAEIVRADKFVRAQPSAAAWNAGRILIPRNARWADKFISEVCSFTGVGDLHDDQVDALTALYHTLAGKNVPRRVGKERITPF